MVSGRDRRLPPNRIPSNSDRCEAEVGASGGRCLLMWHRWYQVRQAPAPHMPGGMGGYAGPMALCAIHLRVARDGRRPLYLADAFPEHRAFGYGGTGQDWRPGPPPNYLIEGHPEYRLPT